MVFSRQNILAMLNRTLPRLLFFSKKLPTNHNGYWIWLGRKSWRSIYIRYEPYMTRTISSYLGVGGVFWDVGANIGLFSLCAAKISGPEGRVVSFEPSPEVFRLLSENVENCSSIVALRYGVGNSESVAELASQGTSSAASFVEEVTLLSQHYHKEVPIVKTKVSMRKLDSLIDSLPLPNLVKVDVEGFELEALKGAKRLLESVRPFLIIEIHPLQLALSGGGEQELLDLLKTYSYEYQVIDRNPNSLYSIVATPPATGSAIEDLSAFQRVS
jgi:FkbM family methyltransferase